MPPCNSTDTGTGTLKCEACPKGCQVYSLSPKEPDRLANERAYYPLPHSSPPADVLLFRAHSGTLWGSVRTDIAKGQSNWSVVAETTIPNDNSNLNAGVLPDGKGVFLLSNAAPAHIRDPLTISLSKDGKRLDLLHLRHHPRRHQLHRHQAALIIVTWYHFRHRDSLVQNGFVLSS